MINAQIAFVVAANINHVTNGLSAEREGESGESDPIDHVEHGLNAVRIENQTDKDILAAIEAALRCDAVNLVRQRRPLLH